MIRNRVLGGIVALRRLEEFGQQAYRALGRAEQTAVAALKEEIDEQVARLKGGRASR